MLIHDQRCLAAVRALLKGADSVRIAVAFWGAGSESVFEHWQGASLRIVCNLALGGTNPAAIRKLIGTAEVRQLDNLHAKLLLTERAMILGSANMSANGLGFEGHEAAGFKELGLQCADANALRKADAWFESIWTSSQPVIERDLQRAETQWSKRRSTRPIWKTATSLLTQPASVLKDRQIYFAVFRTHLSTKGKERLKEENEKLESSHEKLDGYEDWDGALPSDSEAVIIPVYWGQRGRVIISRPQRMVPELTIKKRGWRMDFAAIVEDSDSSGLPFDLSGAERRSLAPGVKAWLESREDVDDGLCIAVYEFLHWRENRKRA